MKHARSGLYSFVKTIVLITFILSTCLNPIALPTVDAGYNPDYGWKYDYSLDTTATTPTYFDLDLDSEGRPHVAYHNTPDNTLVYKYYDGTQWIANPVAFGSFTNISLEIDASGRPHIAAYLSTSSVAIYFVWDGMQWDSYSVLPAQTSGGQFISLALTDGGMPVVAFNNTTSGNLSFAKFNGSGFDSEEVDNVSTTGDYYSFISLQLDSNDQPHIAYCQGPAVGSCSELRYAAFDGTNWAAEAVDRTGGLDVGYYASLALDSQGEPMIAYHIDNTSLNLAYRDGGNWTNRVVQNSDTGWYVNLAFDKADRPALAYYQPSDSSLQYIYLDRDEWLQNMNPVRVGAGQYTSLELDAADNPVVASWDTNATNYVLAAYAPAPDLTVTQIWADTTDNRLLATVRNVGLGTYEGELEVELYLEGVYVNVWGDTPTILPGQAVTADLPLPGCPTPPDVEVRVSLTPYVSENTDTNNALTETWLCDTTPVKISNFQISGITPAGFTATWTTNKAADTRLVYKTANGRAGQTYTNAALVTNHSAVITGLAPHTLYYAQAFSEDAGGLQGSSKEVTVKTTAPSGVPPAAPTIQVQRSNTLEEIFDLSATYADTSNIQRVEFYLDGSLIGADYTPTNSRYDLPLKPSARFATRDLFYKSHTLEAKAITYDGQAVLSPYPFTPTNDTPPTESFLVNPASDSTYYTPGTAVSAGTSITTIEVFAREFEWQCNLTTGGAASLFCGDVDKPVRKVQFFINNTLMGTDTTPVENLYQFEWKPSAPLPVGVYTIKAVVTASDGSTQEHLATLRIVQGLPDLSINRSVIRDGNSFDVSVTITNAANSVLSVDLTEFHDTFKGFQVVTVDYGTYTIATNLHLQGKQTTADITFTPARTLAPGASTSIGYTIVPVLFSDMDSAAYRIGFGNSKVHYAAGATDKIKSIPAETTLVQADSGNQSVKDAAFSAFRHADYLIITDPGALTDHYVRDDVYTLVGKMASLASLKQGVLAYWDSALGMQNLNRLLEDDSRWSNLLHPAFEFTGRGYVLLVGETEIIPSDTTGPYELYWSGTDGVDDYDAHFVDNTYAHTGGNGAPDLLLGRITGETAARLIQPILSSIETRLSGGYHPDEAYVASGTGDGEGNFQSAANTVTTTLTNDGYTVSKHHWEEEAFLSVFPGLPFAMHDGLTQADLDGDGTEEIIWLEDASNKVYAINGDTGVAVELFDLDTQGKNFEDGDIIAAGDVDNDGFPELVHADRADFIYSWELVGALKGNITGQIQYSFAMGEKVAVGDVDTASPGDEIVISDTSDFIRVFRNNNNTPLRAINVGALGFNISDYDLLQVGNIYSTMPDPEEIVFTDLVHDQIIVLSGGGAAWPVYNYEVQAGDGLVLANVSGDAFKEIILADRDDSFSTFVFSNANPSHHTHVDFEEFDGIVRRTVAGQTYDQVFHVDRGDVLRSVDMDYPNYAVDLLKAAVPGVDLLWFNGHGNADGVGPAFLSSQFPLDFDGSHPIANAWSCLTGNYEGYGQASIVNRFFTDGGGLYTGATEVSPQGPNNESGKVLYKDYWDDDETFARAFRKFKDDYWDNGDLDWWPYQINIYNIYGDPKFDIPGHTLLSTSGALDIQALQPAALPPTLTIDLPAFTRETIDGVDYIDIPSDDALGTHSGTLNTGQHEYPVPMYIHTIEVPAGEQVQSVTLTNRDDRSIYENINLPLIEMAESSASGSLLPALRPQVLSSVPGHDWSPNFEQPFTWSVYDQVEGGSTLTIILHPFYYDPAALYAEYYRHFEFDIETISTTVTITDASTDKPAYNPGETVLLDLKVENSGVTPQNLVVSTSLLKNGTGEAVEGFDLAALDQLTGEGLLNLAWNWSNPAILPGDYTIEIVIEDMEGHRLAQRSVDINLGVTSGEVTAFSAAPELFQIGENVTGSLEFTNTGSIILSGQVVIQIQTEDGEMITEFTQDFASLAPGASITLPYTWNSTGATAADFRAVGYVSFASQTTPALVIPLTTHAEVYLPLLVR